ncbi:Sperm-specific antigen 2 -like protein Ki-ras-induced actin-interacting protein [Channa argus]|uniref:Sperm-specific antigen 2-like protein Ki-ras-induced actin-interacting protein n=1 Tax=Channa argus TaxID=215402 RepID=A0A6G1PXB0_CHAAH|nr:Sperm-specific antigen 2 -like protein Ki-ras-induced actin-interacting protein [Channa argus]
MRLLSKRQTQFDDLDTRGPRGPAECNIACMKRLAWAKSRDSLWQESGQEHSAPQRGQQSQGNEDAQKPSEPGQVPNKITSWLIECRTPLGASLDDQSASPSRGVLKNGCSFEDDLSLGAEANYLQSTSSKTESCFSLVAEEKRSQFKERGRSMNSTGSGKSSTVSSVSELLDLYEEDPEEILLNLGFGQEEPDLASKVPNRFFNSSSSARGIDIKVYLAAQMQRMELENPNYALTSRFRQIEVLTTVANEFFQLYSQVSGQPVQRISTREQGGEEGEEGADSTPPPLKRTSSARNVAKLLKKTLTKHNLLAASSESPDTHTPNQHTQLNGHSPLDHTHGNGNTGPEQNSCSSDPDHQGDIVSPKHSRKKDNCPLATVTEETNGDGETDRLTNESPEKSSTGPAAKREQQTISADLQLTNEGTVERTQVVKEEEEKNLPSNPEKPPCSLAPPQLAQLLIENTGSFDMEEIQSNEDEMLPVRSSRANDLSRTVSQQSDSSGFAEEPSADANSSLKVQESSDSCDSETTVTSHPSQDLATPVATDQLVFELPDCREVEEQPCGTAAAGHRSQETTQHTQIQTEIAPSTEPPTERVGVMDKAQEGQAVLKDSGLVCPPAPSSPVLSALQRAKQVKMSWTGQGRDQQLGEVSKTLGRGRGRRGIPMQRSSSLPTSLLSPSRVVSSVRIQFGRGQASCTQPRYSFKYTPESGVDNEEKGEEDGEEEQTSKAFHTTSNPTEANPTTPDAVNLFPGELHLNPNPYTYTVNTPPQYPSPLQPYASLPNLHDHYSPSHHSSLTSLHHPATPTISQHGSLTNLLQPSTSTTPHHVGVGNPHPGSPMMHYHGYSYPQSHHSPYYAAPHVSPFASPYLGYHGYTMSPHPAFPHPISQCPPLAPEHSLVQGLTPPAPGFFPGMGTAFGPGHNLHPGLTPPAAPVPISNQGPSSTEMQLRRVLHDIRGTVQSLNQNRSDTPDTLSEHRATFPSHQSLAEFQQKRRSLNVFRSQMMDLEMSIIRQQAMVYKHLSPGDRLEMEQLQSLRSAVREELQELEQQLEDRLLELTHHTQHRVSDLLREQLFLQSELSYDGNTPSTNLSSRSSSPGRGERGDSEQRQGTYRASINITPTLPRRPNTQTEEGKEEEAERDGEGGRVDTEVSEETGAAGGGLRVGNLQHLLREIRESVAQEVRQEIYSPSEDESSPVAERPHQAGSGKRSPKEKTSPQTSPVGRSPASSGSDSSSSSDDEDEHNGVLRKIRSSVAQIKVRKK